MNKSAVVAAENRSVVNDRFSMKRLSMVMRYYLSRMRLYMILCPVISIALLVLADLAGLGRGDMVAVSVLGLLCYLVGLAPLKFAKRENLEISQTLPARGSEKCVAVLIISFILIPVLVFGPIYIGTWILYGSPTFVGFEKGNEMVQLMNSGWATAYSLSALFAGVSSCLWGVFGPKRLKILYGVIGYFAIDVAVFIISVIWGIIFAMRLVSENGDFNPDIDPVRIMEACMGMFKYLVPVLSIYAIFALTKACRAICRKQI